MSRTDAAPLTAILLPRPASFAAIAAAWDRGEAALPLDPNAPGPELAGLLDALAPTHIQDADGRRRRAGGRPVEAGVAAVVATSGTTGAPRGVELTAEAIQASCRAVTAALGATSADGWLCCLSPRSVAGLAILARARHVGAALEVQPRFEPAGVAAAGGRGATLVSLVPTMLARLLDAGINLRGYRAVLLGGAAAPPALLDRSREAGTPVVTTYGMTETVGGVVHDGHPLPGVRFRVAGSRRGHWPAEGDLEVAGPMLFRRYRNDPEGTAEALHGGWFRTADVGRVAGLDGPLEVLGRADDVVVTGGTNVHPVEVERVLLVHPAVADVAVAGSPDPEWGERLVAFVVPRDAATPPRLDELRAFGAEHLSAAKLPRELRLATELPRSPSGKLLRRRLTGRQTSG